MDYRYGKLRKANISENQKQKLPRSRCRKVWNAYARYSILPVILPPRIVKDLDRIKDCETKYRITDENGVYFYGKPNTGKTVEASMIYVEWYYENIWKPASNEKKCHFLTMPDFMQELKDSISNPEKSNQQVLDYFKTLDLLVLDDFGADRIGDWAYQSLYYLINYRYEHLLPTVYTSNFSLEVIAEQLKDERLVKRIYAAGKVIEKEKTFKST